MIKMFIGRSETVYFAVPTNELQKLTREIARDMGGEQPTDEEWAVFFGAGGNISSASTEKIWAAQRLVSAGYRKA